MAEGEDFKEKLRSVSFSRPSRRESPKVTKDELGNVVTEHWNDRQDVTINASAINVKAVVQNEG